jgi:oligopeptide transport system permease protein
MTPAARAFRRLLANRMAVIGLFILTVTIILSIAAPLVSPWEYDQENLPRQYQPPSFSHPFGTDALGRDLLARVLVGGRVSLSVGFLTVIVALTIGVLYGSIAGYLGGAVDEFMMRIVDILYSMPYMFFVILLMVLFGRKFYLLFIGIGAVSWMTIARIVRGQIITVKGELYIEAARAIGHNPVYILFAQVLPNCMGPIVVYITLTIPSIMLQEAFLSFIGLGVQPPMTSWGLLASEGKDAITSAPWLILVPGIVMAVVLFSFNFLGEGLREALDPRGRLK